jgi:UDP-glucose 4-epimerase
MIAVMVTGATTAVGCALVKTLARDPLVRHVLAVGVEPCPHELAGNLAGNLAGELAGNLAEGGRVTYACVDLTRPREMWRLLYGQARKLAIDCVVHTALHRSARDTGRKVHLLNVETTRELLRLSERHPTIRRFVYRSYSEVYRADYDLPNLIGEEHPLELRPAAPQRLRDRVEADLTVCTRMGMSRLGITVLRCSEIFVPDVGSQLHDYLRSRLCLRPLGFDPMINLLSLEDAVRAIELALRHPVPGIFNIPGWDTLPLSHVVRLCRRPDIQLPGPLLQPIYWLRARAFGAEFRYDMNHGRFHVSGVLDGARAREHLRYQAEHPVSWQL